MKKRIITIMAILATMSLSGCSKLILPEQASAYTESYKNKKQEAKDYIMGEVTLKAGDYVVYSDEGTNCEITSGNKSEKFTDREFIEVKDETDVTITHGKLLPLDEAAGKNVKLFKEGVYLVGLDAIEENVLTDGDMIEVTPKIPVLFETPTSVCFQRWGEVEVKDGMCIRLVDSNEVSRPKWDIDSAVMAFEASWKDTSIKAKNGTGNEYSYGNSNNLAGTLVSKGEFKTLYEDTVYAISTDESCINLKTDTGTDMRIYEDYVIFQCSEDTNLEGDDFYITNLGDMGEATQVETYHLTDGMNYVGCACAPGTYKITEGSAQILDEVPELDELEDLQDLFSDSLTYQKGSVITISSGQVIYSKDLTITPEE